ncbi:PTS-dependent dihydroxyacetone kinase phosphotransferase subunit DhaM [Deinococcus roseus]|uniref:PTS-dependent dihydroxyacetone kinase phosphotransferase subunit DhaM n=2 Tax=Deinococcus roseus TaxID=392414 RepID=A0ABQ2CXN5_9DEIO|nr:PTS-dependent dihydroxyacetone kinase phosphotransferase subunit DhaM [Deinococcus roseus]
MSTAIVVVAHTQQLAQSVLELTLQMTRTPHQIWAVGGSDHGGVGTSSRRIEEALHAALENHDGAVLLLDLGSACLNARIAAEKFRDKPVYIADAPLVEGSILAGVAAAAGEAPETVKQRAEEARNIRKVIGTVE